MKMKLIVTEYSAFQELLCSSLTMKLIKKWFTESGMKEPDWLVVLIINDEIDS